MAAVVRVSPIQSYNYLLLLEVWRAIPVIHYFEAQNFLSLVFFS